MSPPVKLTLVYDFAAGFCPDCVRSNPAVERAAERSKVNLLRVDVGTSAEWRATDHPLRVDSRTSLRCIPTLVHWTESGPAERLGECRSPTSDCDILPLTTIIIVINPRHHCRNRAREGPRRTGGGLGDGVHCQGNSWREQFMTPDTLKLLHYIARWKWVQGTRYKESTSVSTLQCPPPCPKN